MKKLSRIASFALAFALAFVVVGCGKTTKAPAGTTAAPVVTTVSKQSLLDADVQQLQDAYSEGIAIKKAGSLNLPTTLRNGSTVTWATSDATVVTAAGEAVVGATNELKVDSDGLLVVNGEAKLTATVALEGATSRTVEIEVTKAAPIDATALAIYRAYQAVLVEFQGKALSGYLPEFGDDGSVIQKATIVLPQPEAVSLAFTSTSHIVVAEEPNKDDAGNVTGINAVVTRPSAAETGEHNQLIEKLGIKLTVGEVSYDAFIPMLMDYQALHVVESCTALRMYVKEQIEAGESDYLSETFVIPGTVTEILENPSTDGGYLKFFMQDANYGFYIYNGPTGFPTDLHYGDYVYVATTVTMYDGIIETKKCSAIQVAKLAADNAEAIAAMTKYQITKDNWNETAPLYHDAQMASVETMFYLSGKMEKGVTARTIDFLLPDLKTKVTIKVDKYSHDFNDILTIVNGLKVGDAVTVSTGIISFETTKPMLQICTAAGIAKSNVELNDEQKIFFDEKLLECVEIVEPSKEYTLPAGQVGATISWALKEPVEGFAVAEGKLTTPAFEGTHTLTLVATISSGEAEAKTKEFEVTALVPVALKQFMAGTATAAVVKAEVVSVQKSFILLRDEDGKLVMANAAIAEGVKAGQSVLVNVTGRATEQGALYTVLTVDKVFSAEGDEKVYAGKIVKAEADLENKFEVLEFYEVELTAEGLTLGAKKVAFTGEDGKALAAGKYNHLSVVLTSVTDAGVYKVQVLASYNEYSELDDLEEGKFITVMGTIMGFNNSRAIFIADQNGKTIVASAAGLITTYSLEVGDVVVIKGAKNEYQGLLQLDPTNGSVCKVFGVNQATSKEVFIAACGTAVTDGTTLPATDPTLPQLTFSGLTAQGSVPADVTAAKRLSINMQDANNKKIVIYLNSGCWTMEQENAVLAIVRGLTEGQTLTVSGWYSPYNGTIQIVPCIETLTVVNPA